MSNVRTLLDEAISRLADTSEHPALDAQVLLAHVLRRDRSWLFAWPEHVPDKDQQARFVKLVEQRADGVPVAHLTGEREFWSLPLKVTADTLIPRPETELLVEQILALPLATNAQVLDLGTGSGAIALALASERPDWSLTASDRSAAALATAGENARRLGLRNLRLVHSDWFDAIGPESRFDLIVSNPPYVAAADPHLALGDVRFEPRSALVAGEDGLDDIRRIVAQAPAHLRPGGWLWLEHGHDQGARVAALLRAAGFVQTVLQHDLAGLERCSGARLR